MSNTYTLGSVYIFNRLLGLKNCDLSKASYQNALSTVFLVRLLESALKGREDTESKKLYIKYKLLGY